MGSFVLLLAFLGQAPKLDHDLGAELAPEVKAYLDYRFERVDAKIDLVRGELLAAIADLRPKTAIKAAASSAPVVVRTVSPDCTCVNCTGIDCNCTAGGSVGAAMSVSQPTMYYSTSGLFGRRVTRSYSYQQPAATTFSKQAMYGAAPTAVRGNNAVRGYCLPNGQCFYPTN